MDQTEILSTIALIISVGGTILAVINHKRIRSNCCGKKAEVSLEIDTTAKSESPV
jgi:hypothetical protein